MFPEGRTLFLSWRSLIIHSNFRWRHQKWLSPPQMSERQKPATEGSGRKWSV